MSYVFATIVEQQDVDETWAPRIVDAAGGVAWSDADGPAQRFAATGLAVYRGKVDSRNQLLSVSDVDISVHVSDIRLVAVCPKFDVKSAAVGGIGAPPATDTVSRSHGRFLAGQMYWPWLSDIGYTEKTGWTSANQLRLVAMDGASGEWLYVDFQLPKRESPRRIAEQILARAAGARREYATVTDEQRDVLTQIALPRYDADSKRFATVGVPGARKALAETARPALRVAPAAAMATQPIEFAPPVTEVLEERPPASPADGLEERPPASPADGLEERPPASPADDLEPAPPAGAPDPEPSPPPDPEAVTAPLPAPVRACAACARPLSASARFCRACGAKVAAPAEAVAEAPPPPAAKPACPSCGAPIAPQARFCRRCGHRLTALESSALAPPATTAAAAPSPPSAPAAFAVDPAPPAARDSESRTQVYGPGQVRSAGSGRRARRGLALGALVLAIAGAVGVFMLLGSNDSKRAPVVGGDRAAKVSEEQSATPVASSTVESQPIEDGTPGGEETPVDPVPTEVPPSVAGLPDPGRYMRLGSFRGQDKAQSRADELQGEGVDARVISSDDGAGMQPAFYVVVQGPIATPAEERRAIRAAKRAGVRDAFVSDFTPASTDLDPADLAGVFTGDLNQNNPKVKRLNRKVPTTMSFDAGGASGTVSYKRPTCGGTLTLLPRTGPVLEYSETISDGNCADGGTWYVRLDGEDLVVTWWLPDVLTFVIGTLKR